LGSNVTEPPADVKPPPGKVAAGFTEKCRLTIPPIRLRTRFAVLDVPRVLKNEMDGVIGWGLVRRSIIEIDADALKISLLSNVPPEAKSWQRFTLGKR